MSDGVRGGADVGVLAMRTSGGEIAVLLWNYHDDDVPGPDAAVHVEIRAPRTKVAAAALWRVDAAHANSYAAWRALGAPIAPDAAQYAQLERASELHAEQVSIAAARHGAGVDVVVPRQGVALLVLGR